MSHPESPTSLSPDALRIIQRLQDANEKLQKQNDQLHRKVDRLLGQLKRVQELLEKSLRAGKRQAAPFSKGKPKANPKRPGRKSGAAHGPSHFRGKPDSVDRTLNVPLPSQCPCCCGRLEEDFVGVQYQWDIPHIEPFVTQFNVSVGHCTDCGERVQGRHTDQTSDALGAAGRQIGPNAIALATHLNKVVGATYAKMGVFFKVAFNFPVATSTLVRALLRLARKMKPAYDQIRMLVRHSPVVYPDETGWRIGGRKAWLWVFVGDRAVLYAIARYRGFSVAAWALGKNFSGFLGHDGWSIYDSFEKATHQTCLGHLLVRCKELLEVATKRAVSFPRELKAILQAAFNLRDRVFAGDLTAFERMIALGRLKARLEGALSMALSHRGNARLARHIEKHKDELFPFVEHPRLLQGTNALAEQETRPAVILRKISGCNKTWNGAHAHEILVSILRTAWHRNIADLQFLIEALRAPGRLIVRLPAFLTTSGP